MRKLIRHPEDFWCGVLYVGVGAAAGWIAQGYKLGTSVRMGPGYFPTVLAVALGLVGLISLVRSFTHDGEPIARFAWREIGLIIGSVVLFGLTVRGAGLVPALIGMIVVSTLASPESRWKTTAGLALVCALGSALIFIKGLGLPLPIVGPWFGV